MQTLSSGAIWWLMLKEGVGYDNKKNFYEPTNKPAIFQGGEDRNGERAVDMIHNSRVNYDKAREDICYTRCLHLAWAG